jgi:hypothetical protein
MPKRIQMTRQRPWRADNPGAVIVARPSWYGNDYRVVKGPDGWHVLWLNGMTAHVHPSPTEARRHAVQLYEKDLSTLLGGEEPLAEQARWRLAFLGGHDLACWCPLDQPCHADVLLELANPDERPGEVR